MSHLSTVWARPVTPPTTDDDVFKALADPSRRLLLDSLFVRDGQTLGGLSAPLPSMTRFGVMKHLRQLEHAGLVITRKVGREKLHYLNPVPIRLMHDRWIGKYAEPWVGALSDLKADLEGATMDRPRHVFQVYIRTAPELYWRRDGSLAVEGEVLDADPPRRLVTTWSFRNRPEYDNDPPSRVTWEIE